jgi:hypothetical protein
MEKYLITRSVLFVAFVKYYAQQGGEMKEDGMRGTRVTQRSAAKCIQKFNRNTRRKTSLKLPKVDGRLILKRLFKK